MRLLTNFKKFLKSQSKNKNGQAIMEYVVISSLMLAIFIAGFIDFFYVPSGSENDDNYKFSLFGKIKNAVFQVYDDSWQMIQYGVVQEDFN